MIPWHRGFPFDEKEKASLCNRDKEEEEKTLI